MPVPIADLDQYFKDRLAGANSKEAAVDLAYQEKVAGLKRIQGAIASGNDVTAVNRSDADLIKDTGVALAKGVAAIPAAALGLADLVSGGAVGQAFKEKLGYSPKAINEALDRQYSESQQRDNKYVGSADGFVETLKRAASRPSTIANSVEESLPVMVAGGAVGRGLTSLGARAVGEGLAGPALPGALARAVGTETAPVVAGALGEGIVGAGSAATQIREESVDGRLSFKQALAAAASGVGTAAFGLAGGKLAQVVNLSDLSSPRPGVNTPDQSFGPTCVNGLLLPALLQL